MKSTIIAILALVLTGCGSDREDLPPGIYGPGNVRLSQTVAEVETEHPKWKLLGYESLGNGVEARQYEDYHWTWMAGFLHSPEVHTLTFTAGKLSAWSTQ